ncbi:MAG: hypothetical protein U9P90_03615 [Patescibacteria group bacterium]|nr:hypothetical protein [Patescibacteria group bacterium]
MNKFASAVILALLVCGCNPDVNLPNYRNTETEEPAPTTLSGIYEVRFYEVEDTCAVRDNKADSIDALVWLVVTTQEQIEDDGFIVNLTVAGLEWYQVEVAPDGTMENLKTFDNGRTSHIVGTLTPDEVIATITLYSPNSPTGEVDCRATYEINGYLLFERATNDEDDEFYPWEQQNKTVSGFYDIHVVQTVSSCDANFRPWQAWTLATVIEQERLADGSRMVNLYLNLWTAMLSIQGLMVDPNGEINIVSMYLSLSGTLTPNQMTFSVELNSLGAQVCFLFYEIDGHPLLERNEHSE